MQSLQPALEPFLDPVQLRTAVADLCAHERVVVMQRSHAVQVYKTAAARDISVHLPRTDGVIWVVAAAPGT